MRAFVIMAALLLLGGAALPLRAAAAEDAAPAALTARVNAFIDEWHADAAHARPAYFEKIAPDGIYIGTDRTERWTRDAFQAWAAPHFARESAWTLVPRARHVSATADGSVIWFDEQLDSGMGLLQATGVMRAAGDRLEIVHYQLSIAVPNEVQPRVTEIIAGSEGKK
ncbi:MAG: nuclear transport factor 2 family protein [bacterium]|nr:nuclear transport factor 2 family protein [bacterium]